MQIVVNMLHELREQLPAPKNRKGADIRRSVSQRGYSGRAPKTSTSQLSQPTIHQADGGRGCGGNGAHIPGNGDQAWQARANNVDGDMRGPQRHPHAPAAGMHPPLPHGEAPMPYSSYGMNAGLVPRLGGGASPTLFPSIVGGIPPTHNMHNNKFNSFNGYANTPSMPSGPTPAPLHQFNNHETPNGTHNHYQTKNSHHNAVGANMGGGARGVKPRYDESAYSGASFVGGYGGGDARGGVAVDVRRSGMSGGGGGGSRKSVRLLSEVLSSSLSVSTAEASSALAESRQPLLRRFLAEGTMPSGDDRGGQIADKFLQTLEVQLPPVLTLLASLGAGDVAASEEVVTVLTCIHWALMSRTAPVALRACRLLTSVASLLQQGARGGWGGAGGGGSVMSRVVWGWAAARVAPPVGGAIGAVLAMLQQHGVAGGQASEVASAVAPLMYELSGRGLGMRQLFAIEIPARGGAGRGGGLLLLATVVEAMSVHSPSTREALVRSGVLNELSHTSMRDAAGSGGAAVAAMAAADGGSASALAAVEEIQVCSIVWVCLDR